MKEIWKDIKGYKGKYQVSNIGRVKRLSRRMKTERWIKKVGRNTTKEKILSSIKKSIGYTQVNLGKKGKMRVYLIHRLVGEAFIPNPENKSQINHKDGNKSNNRIDNLEWVTPRENDLHSYRVLGHTGWTKGRFGRKHPTSKPVLQKTLDGRLIRKWECALDAVREGGFDSGNISHCCRGEHKQHKGFIWEYATR